MKAQATAAARGRAYDLFGQILLRGLSSELLPLVAALPDLAPHLRAPYDGDEEAAIFQHLFRFNVFAHESIFLGPESMLGGEIGGQVQAFYEQVGFDPGALDIPPDHLGVELALMGYLCGAEADAWEDGENAQARRMRALQRRFLDEHLLRWLPAVVRATGQQGEPLYGALADLTLALACDHRRALPAAPTPFALPPLPPLLEEEGTGLKEIARFLLTPAYSGFYLSRDDVGRLSREQRLPRGFGERRLMLGNLFRSGVEYDTLEALLQALASLIRQWQHFYAQLASETPRLSNLVRPWQERLAHTESLLFEIQKGQRAADASRPWRAPPSP